VITKEKFEMVWRALKHAGILDPIRSFPLVSQLNAGQYHGIIWFIPDATNILTWNLYFYKVNRNDKGKLIETFEDEKGMYDVDYLQELYRLTFKRHYLEVIENIDEALDCYTTVVEIYREDGVNYEDFMVYDHEIDYGEEMGLYGKYIISPLEDINKKGAFVDLWIELDENGKEVFRGNTAGGEGFRLYEIIKNKKEALGIRLAHKDLMMKSYPYFEKDPEYSKGKKIAVPVYKATLEEFDTKEDLLDFLYKRVKELSSKYRYEAEFFDDYIKRGSEELSSLIGV